MVRLRPRTVLLAGLLLAFGAGAAVLVSGSWLAGPLEARLSKAIGAPVTIDGRTSLRLIGAPGLTLRHLSLRKEGFPRPFATIEEMRARIDLHQLLRRHLVLPEIVLIRPSINLERDHKGHPNWSPGPEADTASSNAGEDPIIGKLTVVDGRLSYREDGKSTDMEASVRSTAADGTGRDALVVEGRGTYRDQPSTIRAIGGAAIELLSASKPYRIDAAAQFGATRLKGSGTLVDPFDTVRADLDITADGENAGDLFPILGLPAPPTPPYHLTGKLSRNASTWTLDGFAGTVGDSDLGGSLQFASRNDRLSVSGNLASKTLDSADLGLLVGAPKADGAPAPSRSPDDRVLPNAPINLEELRDADVDVTFVAEHLLARRLPLENVRAHVVLDNARLTLSPLEIGVAGGRIYSSIAIDARRDDVATDFDIRFQDFQIDSFLRSAGFLKGSGGTIEGRIAAHGTGGSVRQSLATADGQASAFVDGASISGLTADILGVDVTRALGILVSGNRRAPVRCLVADFGLASGVMTPRTLLLETDSARVTGRGRIDLANEQLDLQLSSAPRQGPVPAIATPISIGGTFRNPSIDVTAGTVARGSASAALGIFLSPLSAITGLIDPSTRRGVDCAQLKRQIDARFPAWTDQSQPPGAAPTP